MASLLLVLTLDGTVFLVAMYLAGAIDVVRALFISLSQLGGISLGPFSPVVLLVLDLHRPRILAALGGRGFGNRFLTRRRCGGLAFGHGNGSGAIRNRVGSRGGRLLVSTQR